MIDAHRGAFEYDWRTRFGKPLRVVGRSMSWGEALRLTKILLSDPSSLVTAHAAGWEHPVTREDMVLRDLFDLTHQAALAGSKKRAKPYPRPWKTARSRTKPAASVTQADILAALRHAGHTAPIPLKEAG